MSELTCKTCKWLDVPLNKAGQRIVRQGGYRCLFPIPDFSNALPLSVTLAATYRPMKDSQKSWIHSGDVGCPVHSAKVRP